MRRAERRAQPALGHAETVEADTSREAGAEVAVAGGPLAASP